MTLLLLAAGACATWTVVVPADDDSGPAMPIAWYRDADGDGYGDPEARLASAVPLHGYVTTAGDCNDGDPAVNPGATETCDGVDDDCDGSTDETGALGCTPFHADADGDGYGSPTRSACRCAAGEIYNTSDTADCDDGDSAVHPEVVEICGDGIDQDCDGRSPGCRSTGSWDLGDAGAFKLVGEEPGDYAGHVVSGPGDVDGDGFDDVLVGAWRSATGATRTAAAYLLYGPVTAGGDLARADARLLGPGAGADTGYAVSGAGDVNRDGLADILVGGWRNDTGGTGAGAAFLLYGPVSGDLSLDLADASFVGEEEEDAAGYAVSGAGDVDGDGFADVLVGAPDQIGNADPGVVYLLRGPLAGDLDLGLADARFDGEQRDDLAGSAVAGAGDVDGDGFDDVLVGASHHDGGGPSAGAAYLLCGPLDADRRLSLADARLLGEEPGDLAGYAVAGAGDVDGDGAADLLVGAPQSDDGGVSAGAAYLLYGPVEGDLDLSLADARLRGGEAGAFAGYDVSGAGDVDGDGFDDVLVGVAEDDSGGPDAGAACLLYGPVGAGLDLALADARFEGEDAEDHAGKSVSGAGDVDGDGFADLLVGASHDDDGGQAAGAAYLLLFATMP